MVHNLRSRNICGTTPLRNKERLEKTINENETPLCPESVQSDFVNDNSFRKNKIISNNITTNAQLTLENDEHQNSRSDEQHSDMEISAIEYINSVKEMQADTNSDMELTEIFTFDKNMNISKNKTVRFLHSTIITNNNENIMSKDSTKTKNNRKEDSFRSFTNSPKSDNDDSGYDSMGLSRFKRNIHIAIDLVIFCKTYSKTMGISLYAVHKSLKDEFSYEPKRYRHLIKKYIKMSLNNGRFVQKTVNGARGTFRLSTNLHKSYKNTIKNKKLVSIHNVSNTSFNTHFRHIEQDTSFLINSSFLRSHKSKRE